jgi:hypothetical protein
MVIRRGFRWQSGPRLMVLSARIGRRKRSARGRPPVLRPTSYMSSDAGNSDDALLFCAESEKLTLVVSTR